jgi:hypothetical protein
MKHPAIIHAFLLALTLSAPARAIVVAGNDPNALRLVGSNDFFGTFSLSGVVMVSTDHGSCSGALLNDGVSILTAGHCAAPAFGQSPYASPNVTFMGPLNNGPGTGGYVNAAVAAVLVNPGWDGDYTHGADLAIMQLAAPAPAFATRYSLYTGLPTTDPLLIAGFGFGGTGLTGADPVNFPIDGSLRAGTNVYGADGTINGWSPNLLIGQFYEASDPSTNAFNFLFSYPNPYSSTDEVSTAPGDSGGPSFLNGQIVGVHDITSCIPDPNVSDNCLSPPAITTAGGSFFGEFFGDVSVPGNAAWIASQQVSAPEPATGWLLIAGIGFLARRLRKTP